MLLAIWKKKLEIFKHNKERRLENLTLRKHKMQENHRKTVTNLTISANGYEAV